MGNSCIKDNSFVPPWFNVVVRNGFEEENISDNSEYYAWYNSINNLYAINFYENNNFFQKMMRVILLVTSLINTSGIKYSNELLFALLSLTIKSVLNNR